jgi:hypothetical protein
VDAVGAETLNETGKNMSQLLHSLRRQKIAVAALAGTIAVLVATLVQAGPAQAIPPAQAICNLGTIAVTGARGYVPLTDPIHFTPDVNVIKAQVTADAGVDAGAEIRLAWQFDIGGNVPPPQEGVFGPANFANHQEFFETRSTFALFHLVAGRNTTIQPFIRVSGPATARATLLHRCFTIEFATS